MLRTGEGEDISALRVCASCRPNRLVVNTNPQEYIQEPLKVLQTMYVCDVSVLPLKAEDYRSEA